MRIIKLFFIALTITALGYLFIGEKEPDRKDVIAAPTISPEERAAAEKLAQEKQLVADAEIKAEFKATRPQIMKMLKALMDKKGYIAAVAWGERFANVKDKEFQKLYQEAIRKNGEQQASMNAKMAAKEARLSQLQNINLDAESLHAGRYCKNLVQNQLKAPATAKFPTFPDVRISSTNEFFTVTSQVDAQNSFGTMLRMSYFCRLKYNGGGASGWIADDVRVNEQ